MLPRELVEDLVLPEDGFVVDVVGGFASVARGGEFETDDSPCGVEELDVVN